MSPVLGPFGRVVWGHGNKVPRWKERARPPWTPGLLVPDTWTPQVPEGGAVSLWVPKEPAQALWTEQRKGPGREGRLRLSAPQDGHLLALGFLAGRFGLRPWKATQPLSLLWAAGRVLASDLIGPCRAVMRQAPAVAPTSHRGRACGPGAQGAERPAPASWREGTATTLWTPVCPSWRRRALNGSRGPGLGSSRGESHDRVVYWRGTGPGAWSSSSFLSKERSGSRTHGSTEVPQTLLVVTRKVAKVPEARVGDATVGHPPPRV